MCKSKRSHRGVNRKPRCIYWRGGRLPGNLWSKGRQEAKPGRWACISPARRQTVQRCWNIRCKAESAGSSGWSCGPSKVAAGKEPERFPLTWYRVGGLRNSQVTEFEPQDEALSTPVCGGGANDPPTPKSPVHLCAFAAAKANAGCLNPPDAYSGSQVPGCGPAVPPAPALAPAPCGIRFG